MIRRILNSLLASGLWFAAIMLHLLTAAITTLSVLIIAIATKWINLKL